MKKQSILILFLVLCAISASAAPIGKSKAQAVAASFFQKSSMKAKVKGATAMLSKEYASRKDAPTAFYAFSRGENVVFVSADDEMPAILGYSDRTDLDNLPPAMEWLLDYYAQLTDAVRRGEIQAPKLYASPAAVEPLCKTIWDQEGPYSSLCPEIDGKKTANGCLSTAFAQVMKYYEWPQKAEGKTPEYKSNNKDIIASVDLSTHTYNWADMINDYTGSYTEVQGKAVAQLCYDISVASQMNFGPSSGTPLYMGAEALRTYFGYNKDLYLEYPGFYTEEEWVEKLKNEISQKRPLLFSGNNLHNQKQGHCFVLDGYNAEGLFHVNWGWGGESNDYFLITALTPKKQGVGGGDETANFVYEMHTIFNCIPDRTGTSVAAEHFRFEYGDCMPGTHANGITINHFENLSIDDFHGSLALQLIDEDGKVASQQIVEKDITLKKMQNRSMEVLLDEFDFSGIDDGVYDINLVAVSNATKNEFPTRNTRPNSHIVVENGKLKGVFNSAILEGKIVSCEFESKDDFYINVKVKAEVKNTDDFAYVISDKLFIHINGIIYDYSSGFDTSQIYQYSYTKDINPGEKVDIEYTGILEYYFDDSQFDQQKLKLTLLYPSATLDVKEYLLKDLMATAINGVKADKELNAPTFNTKGQRVNPNAVQGIFIRNGKKIVKK